MKTFDLVVIGAGSGLDVAVESARRGLKTAIVEEGPLGGTCLNRGCIPSKIVIHSADVVETINNSKKFGIEAKINQINFKKIITKANRLVDEDARLIERNVKKIENLTLIKGRAQFIDKYVLKIGRKTITGKKFVLAAGARPFIPKIEGLEQVPYLTSKEALRQTELPESMVVIGGGYVSAELGNFYASLGCKITIIQRSRLLLSKEDRDIAKLFTKLWKNRIITNAEVKKVAKNGKNVEVTIKKGRKTKKITAKKLFIATGVQPNSYLLKVSKTGVKTTKNGFVKVNKFMETNIKNIWALGDLAGKYMFKHSANLEAEGVINNLFGKKKAVDYYAMPHAVFTAPQIAGVGVTEQETEKKITVSKYFYRDTGMGAALAEKKGFVKLITDKKEILGCHIIGPEASVLIHQVLTAMKADRKNALDILKKTIYIHPALNEVVQRAALKS